MPIAQQQQPSNINIQNTNALESVFGSQYLEHLPNSAVQVATSLNNFMDQSRLMNQGERRPSGGLSQLNPLTLSQGNKHPHSLSQINGSSHEEYKEATHFADIFRENSHQNAA